MGTHEQHVRLESNGDMHIITRKRLNEFAAEHPNATSALQQWYKQMKPGSFRSFAELRTVFPSTDQVGTLTVFNIGGNTARLIAAIHYNWQKVYIRAILTHTEYDEDRWKE
jgi:mRNA interferase HigB